VKHGLIFYYLNKYYDSIIHPFTMKNIFNTIITNNKILLSYLAFFAGIGFGIAGICIPPLGYISSSLLILIA